jgi:serine/threonine protein kinase
MPHGDAMQWGVIKHYLLPLPLALAAGVLGWRALAPPQAFDRAQPERLAHGLELQIAKTAAQVHARATTLAELPRVGVIVYTDAATARDLTRHELAFSTGAGETVELWQLLRGRPTGLLLRVPARASALPAADRSGVALNPSGPDLVVSESVLVRESSNPGETEKLGGVLTVGRVIALQSLTERLKAAQLAAGLELDGAPLTLAGLPQAETAHAMRLELSVEKHRLALLVQPPGGSERRGWMAAGATLLLMMAAFAGWSVRRRGGIAPVLDASALATPTPSSPSLSVPALSLASGTLNPPAPTASAISRSASRASAIPSAASLSSRASLVQSPDIAPPSPPREEDDVEITVAPTDAPTMGRYTIVRQLGMGGMANVLLARARGPAGFEKLVALKLLHRNMAADRTIVDHFIAEARLASHVVHPNVVQIIDLGVGEDYFIAMEYVDGADLRTLWHGAAQARQSIPLAVALTIARKVCDGLHAAHTATDGEGTSLQIIHRDVKLANVFVSRTGVVKVGDFGIAQANMLFREYRTEIGQIKGTTAYMAPEQRLGLPIDCRVDVYGVGALAYQLLTGARINLDVARLAQLGQQGWPHLPPPTQLRRDLPFELDQILFKAMSYQPEERHATCEVLEEALGEVATQYDLVATDKAIAQWVQERLKVKIVNVSTSDPGQIFPRVQMAMPKPG